MPLAAWFRRKGARVVLVPPERSADLRNYYAKHVKTDRLDSQLLARLPMLHPEGLHLEEGFGPADALKRGAKLHSTLAHRRTQSLARLDALLEILGPAWHSALGADLANRTPLRFLAAGYADPHAVKRLGRARLARFIYRHSRGAWGDKHADALLAAAAETLQLWSGAELDYPDLADDIAVEARLALHLTEELKDLDERTTLLLQQADPRGSVTSAPGVAQITATAILGRLGDPSRLHSLAGARAFTELVPDPRRRLAPRWSVGMLSVLRWSSRRHACRTVTSLALKFWPNTKAAAWWLYTPSRTGGRGYRVGRKLSRFS